jgi:hypothetical protein
MISLGLHCLNPNIKGTNATQIKYEHSNGGKLNAMRIPDANE